MFDIEDDMDYVKAKIWLLETEMSKLKIILHKMEINVEQCKFNNNKSLRNNSSNSSSRSSSEERRGGGGPESSDDDDDVPRCKGSKK